MPALVKNDDYWNQLCPTPGPGPGAYKLPPTLGYEQHDNSKWRGPAFSLGHRVDTKIRSDTPGPVYDVRGLNRFGRDTCSPGYSINSRVQSMKKTPMPGPGTYAPEKFPYPKGKTPPAFSLRGRVGIRTRWVGPGPNQYMLPATLGYNVPNMKSAPAARLAGRTSVRLKTDSPGPATYGVPNYDAVKFIFPAVSMGGRPSMKIASKSPGPLAYYPKFVCGPNSPAFSLRPRVGRCIKPLITAEDLCD